MIRIWSKIIKILLKYDLGGWMGTSIDSWAKMGTDADNQVSLARPRCPKAMTVRQFRDCDRFLSNSICSDIWLKYD